jgi:hypothetical protein
MIYMTRVSREQFAFNSNLEVVHEPTGATVSTSKYESPLDACSTIKVSWGRMSDWGRIGDPPKGSSDYDRWEVVRMGCELLLERARQDRK